MNDKKRTVSLRKLPGRLDRAQQKALYRELQSAIAIDRPRLVLDCSILERLDEPVIQLLLCCLEEAMKRNGDVRLAAFKPEVRAVFNSFGLEKLFRVFADVDSAVESFRTACISIVPPGHAAIDPDDAQVDAA